MVDILTIQRVEDVGEDHHLECIRIVLKIKKSKMFENAPCANEMNERKLTGRTASGRAGGNTQSCRRM